jgi:hypothetical protein
VAAVFAVVIVVVSGRMMRLAIAQSLPRTRLCGVRLATGERKQIKALFRGVGWAWRRGVRQSRWRRARKGAAPFAVARKALLSTLGQQPPTTLRSEAALIDPEAFTWVEADILYRNSQWGSSPRQGTGTFVAVAVDRARALAALLDPGEPPTRVAPLNFQSFIYVTTEGCADRAATVAITNALADRLTAIAARRPGLGWQVIPLVEAVDFDDFDVDAALLGSVTGGRLPAVNVNLSFDLDDGPAGDPEIDLLLAEHEMVLVARIPDDG